MGVLNGRLKRLRPKLVSSTETSLDEPPLNDDGSANLSDPDVGNQNDLQTAESSRREEEIIQRAAARGAGVAACMEME
jgi:hypothetical protein